MKRLTLALLLCAPTAGAVDWPWRGSETVPANDCVGFVGTGLADTSVRGWSRTELWLAWSRISREGLPRSASFEQDYRAGAERFKSLLSTAGGEDLLHVADGECGLGSY